MKFDCTRSYSNIHQSTQTFELFEIKQQLVVTKREFAKIKKQQVARTKRSSKRDTTSVKGKLERNTT